MDTFKPGRTEFHTFEVWNVDLQTGLNPVPATQLRRWFRPGYNWVKGARKWQI